MSAANFNDAPFLSASEKSPPSPLHHSEVLEEIYQALPSSFLAARFAFMASFLALPPRPAFSCCLVIFGSAHGQRGHRDGQSGAVQRASGCLTLGAWARDVWALGGQ